MNNRWHDAGIIGSPSKSRKIGFSGNALNFHKRYARFCYITDSVKANTVFVDYFTDDNAMDKTFLIDKSLSTFGISNISAVGKIHGYLIHQLICKDCKRQLILLDGMLTCMNCANIK